MLYTNVTLNISGQRLRSGTILAATLDRMSDLRNRGIFLPTPKGLVGKLPMGFHENYTIGSTGKGYPRIALPAGAGVRPGQRTAGAD